MLHDFTLPLPCALVIVLAAGTVPALAAPCQMAIVPQVPVPAPAPASQDPPRKQEPSSAPPVVVTASRTAQDPFEAPRAVDVVGEQQILRGNYRTMPQAIRELPSVMIQETAPGQGSPFLRGFTGYGNLMLIDGVRLNNSTFRSGPNQYWATVDPLSIDSIEVVRGPSSAQWGSDAIGGTVQVFTKSPTRYGNVGTAHGGSLFGRYSTAESSVMARAEYEVARTWEDGTRTGFLVGADARSFGDVEGGSDTGTQLNTAHDETAFDVKIEHWLGDNRRLVFLHQAMLQVDVPRTHATVFGESFRGSDVGTDLQRDLDQTRRLTYLQYHAEKLGGAIDGMHLSVSWHEQREVEDRITNASVERWQEFDVGTLGAFAQFDSQIAGFGKLSYGVDYYHDNVNSWFRRSSGTAASDPIQGQVANDSSYDLFGVFAQAAVPIGDSTEVQVGLRYTYAEVDADSVRDPSTNTKIALQDDWDELTASAFLRYDLIEKTWNVYGGASQGFRTPSLADLTLFDTARSGEIEVPSPGLDAEHYIGYEVGTKVRCDRWSAVGAWYYTDIEDQIQRFPTGTVIGTSPVVTKANVGDGYIQGAELQLGFEVIEATTVYGTGSWQYGRVTNIQGTSLVEDYPSRLMPLVAIVGVRWEDSAGNFHADTFVTRAEDADKLSAGDIRDTQRIPPGGTPSYTTWTIRGGCRISERADFEVALENITDVDYRVHGSGSNSPGRNLVLGMRVVF
ncbi:MAG TPA: TonB-dependent receptor [Planctomycetota bacterium]